MPFPMATPLPDPRWILGAHAERREPVSLTITKQVRPPARVGPLYRKVYIWSGSGRYRR